VYGIESGTRVWVLSVIYFVPREGLVSSVLSNNIYGHYLNRWLLLGSILWRLLNGVLMASTLYCVKFFCWRYLSVRYGVITKSILHYTSRFRHNSGHPQGGALQRIYSWFETYAVFWMLYAFFWVTPRRLNFICWRFGTLCLFHRHRRVGMKNEWLTYSLHGGESFLRS
jgi:hypothetical protein